jgi:hypothetical protein
MENFIQISVQLADVLSGCVNVFLASVTDLFSIPVAGGTVSLAFAGGISRSNISAEVTAMVRRWHGSIDERFGNIDNLVTLIQGHSAWGTPPQFSQVVTNRTQLATLIPKCRSGAGSANDRAHRNTLLKTTVGLCLLQIKLWAYAQYNNDILTIDDLHSLGFLLPGEASGHHARAVATDAVAEVKVRVLSADMIRVAIDQAAGENAALTAHGWPDGVRMALIVITSVDDGKEIYRQLASRLYNDIRMPDGSHGRQFVIKAAFLRHVDDEPRFGPQPTFSMPLMTEDLVAAVDRQHHEEYEAHIREIERQRQEIERLRAALAAGSSGHSHPAEK